MNQHFEGVGVALITPMDENLNIDYSGLKRLLNHVSDHVDYLVVMGTTGENATLSSGEKAEVLDFVKDHNTNDLPIVYGLGGNNTQALLHEMDLIEWDQVSAVLSVSPYYNKPSQKGIITHYQTLANHCPLPLILYNVPGRTASNIEPRTVLTLAQHDNIIGIKDANPDMEHILEIAKSKPKDFLLISGDDATLLPFLSLGGNGIISVAANVYPEIMTGIYTQFVKRDMETAQQWAYKLGDIFPLLFKEGNPIGTKEFAQVLGICDNYVRLPLTEGSIELKAEIKKYVND